MAAAIDRLATVRQPCYQLRSEACQSILSHDCSRTHLL